MSDSELQFMLLSDLHLEIPLTVNNLPTVEAKADYLFLVGDIGRPGKSSLEDFLGSMASKFKHVFFIAGNHEFYRCEYHKAKQDMNEICDKFDNISFLDRNIHIIDNFRIIGATLWSYVPPEDEVNVCKSLSDYAAITIIHGDEPKRKVTVEDTNRWHKEDLEFIKEQIQIAKNENQIAIILTHHAPLMKGTSDPRFEGGDIQSAFATDLKYLMGNPIALWCFGHTHYSSNQIIDNTRIISNQLGYLMKHETDERFNINRVITVKSDGSSNVI